MYITPNILLVLVNHRLSNTGSLFKPVGLDILIYKKHGLCVSAL